MPSTQGRDTRPTISLPWGMTYKRAAILGAGAKALSPELRVKLRYPRAVAENVGYCYGYEHAIYDRPRAAVKSGRGPTAVGVLISRGILGFGDTDREAWRRAASGVEAREGPDVFDRLWERKRRDYLTE